MFNFQQYYKHEILRNKLKHLNIDWGFVSFELGTYLKAGQVTI